MQIWAITSFAEHVCKCSVYLYAGVLFADVVFHSQHNRGSELQLQYKLRKGSVLTDSYRDIHEHYMKDHRENYDIVLGMDEDDLHYMTELISRSSESQS